MKIVVLTYGTEGDTRPLIALSHALIQAGHETILLGEARSLGSARRLSVPVRPLSGDIRTLFTRWGQSGARGTAKALVELTNAQSAAWMAQTLETAQGCDAILVSGLAGFVGLSVAERLAIPAIGAGMIPLTPSNEFPSPFLAPAWVPAPLNRASLRLTNQLLWLGLRKALNRARADVLGLPPRDKLWTTHPMLYGISPTLLPPPRDWPDNAVLCGQWTPPPDSGFIPPAELTQFLDAGPPPIYVGFGSMTGIDLPRMLQTVIQALDGRRAVVWPGWSDMGTMTLPPNILRIDATPHDWLFPKMAAIIHHGGSGTSHTAASAGRPSIILPFAGDQAFWADRLHQLGVAAPAVSPQRLHAKALAQAIAFVEQPAVNARAAQLGQAMARENGLAVAVERMEKWLATRAAR